jgi:multicomponent Na+:H+ antiporter subunit E
MTKRRLFWISGLARSVLFALCWLVLTEGDPSAWVFGALAVPGALALSLWLLPPEHPLQWRRVIAVLPKFLWESVKGGVDVAWRAFMPRMPIAPGWVLLPVALPDTARVALSAELSLMPGTLVAGTQEQQLLVHVLDRDADHSGMAAIEREVADMLGKPAGQP